MSTSTWMDYETGKLSDEECFTQLADARGFAAEDLIHVIHQFRQMVDYEARPLRIVLVSNISTSDYQALRERWDDELWSIFDDVFTSSMIGIRKPSPRFYRHVLRATRSVPRNTFTIDDPGKFPSVTQDGAIIEDNYAPLLILEALKDRFPPRLWNFFGGKPRYTTDTYPDDFDITPSALAVMSYDYDLAQSILDEMLDCVDEDGFIQAYTDKSRPRVDAIISLNVLIKFTLYDRTYELPETLDWLTNILLYRAYISGTRYYPGAEWFLYYLTRLLAASNGRDAALEERLLAPLTAWVTERIGAEGDAFALGMRILAYGVWEASCMYLFPGAKKEVGNRMASTAFAVRHHG
ncbi:hypothetical protein BJX63DRAFT_424497 [Aspergillus granulosus]|uniref:Uncharacterized protein n=1 Tax=Aspergillus granulosus TaxID=176169 RepID=A0ABR4GZB2_9EURO